MASLQRYDLVVVGAGPAGATAALAARRARPDASVLLLDRADFPRDKPCGDGVAPEAVDLWTALGAGPVTHGFGPVHRLTLVGTDGREVTRTMRRPAHVVPRRVLDERLVRAAVAHGAELRRHRVRRVQPTPDGVLVDEEILARRVIGADGPSSVVRRCLRLADPPRAHLAVAMRGYTDLPAGTGDGTQLLAMDGQRWPGYAWSFPVGDGTANVGYGVVLGGRTAPSRAMLEDGLRRCLPWLGPVRALRGHLLPLASFRPRHPDGAVLLAGDAWHLVNPISGEGIAYAALSGSVAGRIAVTSADPGRGYRVTMRRLLARHHLSVRLVAWAGRRASVVDAGLAAAGASQPVFDDMVALALLDGRLTARMLVSTARAAAAAWRGGSAGAPRSSGVH